MLPRLNRLTKRKDFGEIHQQGQITRGRLMMLRAKRNNLKYSRVGIIVSKKVAKKATQRNKIKRRMRQIIREKILLHSGYDFVIILKHNAASVNYEELKDDWQRVWADINQKICH